MLDGGELTISDGNILNGYDLSSNCDDGYEVFWISGIDLGSAALTYTMPDGRSWSADISVCLPFHGFYEQQLRPEETWLRSFHCTPAESTEVWLMRESGYDYDTAAAAVVTLYGETEITLETEAVQRENSEYYDVKVTIPAGLALGNYVIQIKQLTLYASAEFAVVEQLPTKCRLINDMLYVKDIDVDDAATVYAAGYDENGRQLWCVSADVTDGNATMDLSGLDEAHSISVYFMDSGTCVARGSLTIYP